MKISKYLLTGALLIATLAAAPQAQAAPCRDYTRNVFFGDGSGRVAAGTACLDNDGQWRITEEHLTPTIVAPPVVYAPVYEPVYAEPVYYPSASYYYGYPYHRHYGYGYGYGYPISSISFGFSTGGGHYRHHR